MHLTFLSGLKGVYPVVLRLILGYAFFVHHGLDKVRPDDFDWGQEFVRRASGIAPDFLLYAAAWTEFLGGFLLALGLVTRWAALGILCVMLVAFLKVHAHDPFGKQELPLAYAGAAFTILVVGAGPLSLDRLFFGPDAVE